MIRTVLALLPEGSRGRVAAHLSLTVLGVLLRAAGVVLLVPLVAELFGERPAGAWPWVALLAAATGAGWIVDACAARLGFALGFGLLNSAQQGIAERITAIRAHWFDAENTATARQAIAATGPDLVGIVVYLITPLIGAILLPLAIAAALLTVSWELALAALLGVPVLLGAFWASGRLGRAADRVASETNSALTERIIEFARTQQALRAARRADPARSQTGVALEAQHGATMRLLLMQIPGQLLFGFATQLALLLLAGTAVLLAVRGQVPVPEAIALIVVIVRYLEPFGALTELSPGIETAVTALGRLRAVLDAPTDEDERTAALTSRSPDAPTADTAEVEAATPPRIQLRGVEFRYGDDEQPVLDGLDLTFEPGTTTAIVGPSGSGKSTVLSLLAGLRRPTAGHLLIDGVDAADMGTRGLRERVSVVFQQPYLFDGTIRENVLAGLPSADADALRLAASLAQVTEVVDRLPGGWDARTGEGGSVLSGGERQRVSIARALLKPAPVLLVDEATSALDTENEAAIVAALTGDPLPRTRVVVAHRLASIRAADRVIFLEDGLVVEDGTVDGLLASGGRFAEFWRQQDAAKDWRIGQEIGGR